MLNARWACDDSASSKARRLHVLPLPRRARVGAGGRVQALQQPAPALQPLGRQVGRRQQLGRRLEIRRRGVVLGRAHEQRGVGRTQVAARGDVRGAEYRIANALDEPDVGRHAPLAGPQLGQHGTDVRSVGRGAGHAAQQVVHRVEMVADRPGVRHRPDQAEVLGQVRQPHVQLADAHAGDRRGDRRIGAADLGRGGRLQVPGVEVAGAAAQQDEDARFGGAVARPAHPIDAGRHHAGHGEVEQAGAAELQQAAARDRGGGGLQVGREGNAHRVPPGRWVRGQAESPAPRIHHAAPSFATKNREYETAGRQLKSGWILRSVKPDAVGF